VDNSLTNCLSCQKKLSPETEKCFKQIPNPRLSDLESKSLNLRLFKLLTIPKLLALPVVYEICYFLPDFLFLFLLRIPYFYLSKKTVNV